MTQHLSLIPLQRRALLIGLGALPLTTLHFFAQAQPKSAKWVPDRPIKMIVPFPPGGATDTVARLVADQLRVRLGQSVVVDNRGGANGIVAARAAATSAPDGYNLFLGAIGTHAINPYVYPKTAVENEKFTALAAINTLPTAFAVPRNGRATTLEQIIKLGQNGQGNYGHWAVASVPHIAGEIFKKIANIPKLQGIQFQGAAQCLTALIGEQIDIANLPLSLAQAQTERLKIIGLATTARVPNAPDIPTMAELGYPVDIEAWYGLFAPAGTPQTIVDTLTAEINAIVADPEVRKKMFDMALKPQSFPSATAYSAWIQGERTRWASVLRDIGVEPQ